MVLDAREKHSHSVGAVVQVRDACSVQITGQLINVCLQLCKGWVGGKREYIAAEVITNLMILYIENKKTTLYIHKEKLSLSVHSLCNLQLCACVCVKCTDCSLTNYCSVKKFQKYLHMCCKCSSVCPAASPLI